MIEIDDGSLVKIFLIDVGGHMTVEQLLLKNLSQSVDAIILCYDICSSLSFEKVRDWITHLQAYE